MYLVGCCVFGSMFLRPPASGTTHHEDRIHYKFSAKIVGRDSSMAGVKGKVSSIIRSQVDSGGIVGFWIEENTGIDPQTKLLLTAAMETVHHECRK